LKPRIVRGFIPVSIFCDQNRQWVVKKLTLRRAVSSRSDENGPLAVPALNSSPR
jgi:hypothetical protein